MPVSFAELVAVAAAAPPLSIEEKLVARVEYLLLEESTYEPGERRWYEPWETFE